MQDRAVLKSTIVNFLLESAWRYGTVLPTKNTSGEDVLPCVLNASQLSCSSHQRVTLWKTLCFSLEEAGSR